jgi:class 3 adenylate cyclase
MKNSLKHAEASNGTLPQGVFVHRGFKILLFMACLMAFAPLRAEEGMKFYEIGPDAERIRIETFHYFMEPVDLPLDIRKFKDVSTWQTASYSDFLSPGQVRGQRVITVFELQNTIETIYLGYNWGLPHTNQQFIVINKDGIEFPTEVWRSHMLVVSANLPKDRYRVFFIAEPDPHSEYRFSVAVMNPAYMMGKFHEQRRFNSLVYGAGLAFVFLNFVMLLLHRKPYFFYYVSYSLTTLYMLCVGTGDYFEGGIISWYVGSVLNCLFTILMSSSVLRLRKFHASLLRLAFIIWALSSLLMAFRFVIDSRYVTIIGTALGLSCYFICAYAAIRRMLEGFLPAVFFAAGWCVLALGFALSLLSMVFPSFRIVLYSAYAAYAIESMLFAIALAYRMRDSEQRAVQQKVHALSQLGKVVYAHQMEQIKSGSELESTMPTTPGRACVISFDIIGSSKIRHIQSKELFRNVFAHCNAIMSEGYDGHTLKASAYRIKEMGDGFLCSVGYPFQSLTANPANEAIELAQRFAQVLSQDAALLGASKPIACGIGIALDDLIGFYPESGTKEYDLFGPALILATRYEGMRKVLFEADASRSVLIIQAAVFDRLDPSHRISFQSIDLKEAGIVVRDDPAAAQLYYQFLDAERFRE